MRLTLTQNVTGQVPVVIKSVFGRFSNTARPTRVNRFLSPFIKRGYAIGEFSMQELVIDRKGQARAAGVYHLFPDKTVAD